MAYPRVLLIAFLLVGVLPGSLSQAEPAATETVFWGPLGEGPIRPVRAVEGELPPAKPVRLPQERRFDHLPVPAARGPSLGELVQLALEHNPTLLQASAEVGAILGMAYQAGLSRPPSFFI